MNLACLSFTAACRIRPSALCTTSRSCARFVFCRGGFPLARPLRSTRSAIALAMLAVANFVRGLRRYYGSVRLPASVHHRRTSLDFSMRPTAPSAWTHGSPGSRAGCFRACLGSLTARDTNVPCHSGALVVAFPFLQQGRHPDTSVFRGSIPSLHFPLSTLRRGPCATTHDSGPLWLASPLTYDSFIHYTCRFYRRTAGCSKRLRGKAREVR